MRERVITRGVPRRLPSLAILILAALALAPSAWVAQQLGSSLGTIATGVPTVFAILVLVILLATNPLSRKVAWRYLRSERRKTVSVISFIAVAGVALGVAALLAVMSITSGFQQEFREKVLGVNAHVLVLKYGLDFDEYPEVIERAREMPEVHGAAPFLINEMMLAKGDRISGVLVKGVDPELMLDVLDLPDQLSQGSLSGLRVEGAIPPLRPSDLLNGSRDEEWDWLQELADEEIAESPNEDLQEPTVGEPDDESETEAEPEPLVDTPTPEEVEQALAEGDATELPDVDLLDQFFEEEELLFEEGDESAGELPGIVVGTTLARNLGLGVGDRVSVVSPLSGMDTSMFGGSPNTPRSAEFRVIGIFEAGFQEYDSRLVYVDLYEAQRFFDHGDSVTGVEITLDELDAAPEVARRMERILGGGPYHTMDWQELNRNLFAALELQKIALSLIVASITVVAAFNVIATLIMVVLEKKREIAILKAMGATNVSVLLIFMLQGLVIGIIGTLIGLALGGGVTAYFEQNPFPLDPHVYLIDHLPVRTDVEEVLTTVFTAIGICLGATVAPSWWAARLLPAEGVRYE